MGFCCRLLQQYTAFLFPFSAIVLSRQHYEGMEERFSQFSVGELEAGARKRQGLAEARRHAQVRDRIARMFLRPPICSYNEPGSVNAGAGWCAASLSLRRPVLCPFLLTLGIASCESLLYYNPGLPISR